MKTELKNVSQVFDLADCYAKGGEANERPLIEYIDYLHNRIRDYDARMTSIFHSAESAEQKPHEAEKAKNIKPII